MVKRLPYLIIYIFLFSVSNQLQAQVLESDSTTIGEEETTPEEEEEQEAEGEFDESFTGYSDLTYWDLLRDPRFKFDSSMIPNFHYEGAVWDTITINPYKVSLKEMNDTILLSLRDSFGCDFHPPAIGDISSNFGFRRWGRRAKFHYGVDVRMEVGDPVYAMFDGVVRIAKRSADYGYVVLIRHYNGLETLYAHFNQLLVYSGQPVRSGDIIGLAGSTGRSTGPHLHFEVRFKGEKVDPNKIVYFPSGSLLSDTLQIDKGCFAHLYQVKSSQLKSKYHVVRRGETLGKIAYRYGVSVKHLAKLNHMSTKSVLRTGQKLRLR
jgi:murein DD-endopeptidase MepM/ murein hydrolase activator NlpD